MAGLPRNDLRQYDDLAGEWWRPGGAFTPLRGVAAARARLVPAAARPDAVLVDVGCGAGLLAPQLAGKGYRHVGVDLVTSALEQARAHGVTVLRGDATRLPVRDGVADVVVAGELFEHVTDLRSAVAEVCRILRPGGTLVVDTLNDTSLARWLAVTVAERIPAGRGVPPGLHDPNLFVDPDVLTSECARHGVRLQVRGVRPAIRDAVRWLFTGRGEVRIVPTWSVAVLYQGHGTKEGA